MVDIKKIRSDFPILSKKINGKYIVYLDNSATTHKPQEVIDSIVNFYSNMNSNIHRSDHYLSSQASTIFESVRTKIKDYINANKPGEIIFTSGTTDSINLIAKSYGQAFIEKDDEIVISEMEHHSNIVPWQMLCQNKKAKLVVIPLDKNGDLDLHILNERISKKTKLISVTHISNVLGTLNPVKEIIKIAHKKNVPVLIDGAQAIPRLAIDVQSLDCDFYAFSGHKIYAETGVGVMFAKEKWLNAMPPYKYGGGMISKVSFDKTTFADIPFKFEAGTGNISGVLSLGKAIEYIEKIGINEIEKHENLLTDYAFEKLSKLEGVKVYGNPRKRCGVISFNVEGIHHYDAVIILDKMGIALRSGSHCAEPLMTHYKINGNIRASFAIYNSKEDIDKLINGIKKVQEMHN